MTKEEQYTKYVTTYGREIWFFRFLKIFDKVSYRDYEALLKWRKENLELVLDIYTKNQEQINEIEEQEKRDFREYLEECSKQYINRLPNLKEITTYIGMFDES